MGLDMYLRTQQRTKDNQPVESELVPVIQWRKANAIHA